MQGLNIPFRGIPHFDDMQKRYNNPISTCEKMCLYVLKMTQTKPEHVRQSDIEFGVLGFGCWHARLGLGGVPDTGFARF